MCLYVTAVVCLRLMCRSRTTVYPRRAVHMCICMARARVCVCVCVCACVLYKYIGKSIHAHARLLSYPGVRPIDCIHNTESSPLRFTTRLYSA